MGVEGSAWRGLGWVVCGAVGAAYIHKMYNYLVSFLPCVYVGRGEKEGEKRKEKKRKKRKKEAKKKKGEK